jgi:hypothetical protein
MATFALNAARIFWVSFSCLQVKFFNLACGLTRIIHGKA